MTTINTSTARKIHKNTVDCGMYIIGAAQKEIRFAGANTIKQYIEQLLTKDADVKYIAREMHWWEGVVCQIFWTGRRILDLHNF